MTNNIETRLKNIINEGYEGILELEEIISSVYDAINNDEYQKAKELLDEYEDIEKELKKSYVDSYKNGNIFGIPRNRWYD